MKYATHTLSFRKLKAQVKNSGIYSLKEWKKYTTSLFFPTNIPVSPQYYYLSQWRGWKNFLGCEYMTYSEAQHYMQEIGIKNLKEWKAWLVSTERDFRIPSKPAIHYAQAGWKGWDAFFNATQKETHQW